MKPNADQLRRNRDMIAFLQRAADAARAQDNGQLAELRERQINIIRRSEAGEKV